MLASWKKSYDQSIQHIKKQRHYFTDKYLPSQSCGFSSSHVWMWELDYKESWTLKNLCFWTVVLEKTLESPLDCKEIQPVHPKGNQSWIFNGRTDAEAEAPILWSPDVKKWLIGKDPDAGKDWRQEEKGTIEMRWLDGITDFNGHKFEQAPGVGDGQGSLACCSPWGHKESDTAEQLNWTKLNCVPTMACNCNYLLCFIWLLIVRTDKHILLLWLCNYYSLNRFVSWFSSVQWLSCVWLFATAWTAAYQAGQ